MSQFPGTILEYYTIFMPYVIKSIATIITFYFNSSSSKSLYIIGGKQHLLY